MSDTSKKTQGRHTEEATNAGVPLKFVRVPNFQVLYTNFVQSSVTPFDIALLIGQSTGFDGQQRLVVEHHARLIMSPLEAKIVNKILEGAIAQYEGIHGRIPEPPDIGLASSPMAPGDNPDDVAGVDE